MRAGSGVALGAVLAACGGGDSSKNTEGADGSLRDIVAGRPQTLTIVAVQGETLKGERVRYPFALFDVKTNQRYTAGTARLWVAQNQTSKAAGPFEATWHDEMLDDRGVYVTHLPFRTDGAWLVLVEASPVEASGRKLLGGTQVGIGRRSQQPVPGEAAVSVATPTVANARGVNPICTAKPRCSMHDVSLDVALKSGKPTVLVIGSPAFCQSRTCGPVVEIIDTVKARTPKGAVNFIHVELYENNTEAPAKGTLAPAASKWNITEEPVVYFIKRDGTIVDRFVGATGIDEIADQTRALQSA